MKTRFLIIAITVPIAVLGIIFSPILVEMYYLEQKYQQMDLNEIENCKDSDQCVEWFENGTCKMMLAKRCQVPELESLQNTELVERYKDMPEVSAFYAKYEDANVSVRDDHVSYFAGNEDDFRVRMNLYFDENYELDYITLRCYVDRKLQHDVAETFILRYLEKYDCKKSGEIENATSSYMDKIIPTLEDFKNTLSVSQEIDTIFSKFGEPHDDIGSGIHIYVYELNDSTQVWIGYTDKILYVRHVDVEGNILEKLFLE